MRVFITGGTGLIGRNLARTLIQEGHHVVILTRRASEVRRDPAMWPYRVVDGDPAVAGDWQKDVAGCDAVVNLAGHNIFAERWSKSVKGKIRDSRLHAAERLVAALKRSPGRTRVFVQGSAIGYYGAHGDEELTESSPQGSDFLAQVCRETEAATEAVESLGVRRAVVRTGIVLAHGEGALGAMTPIFKLAPGAPIGSGGRLGPAHGQQWMSWIHIDDIVGIFRLALANGQAKGPLNGTSPQPARNADFSRTLSQVLRNPVTPWRFFLPVGPPDALLKLMLGEVATVVATGQKVMPAAPLSLGYSFRYPGLEGAMREIFSRKPATPAASPPAPAGARR